MSHVTSIISNGQYVIIQRKDYNKLHLLSERSDAVFIGKDLIELNVIRGEKSGSVFKMIPKVGFSRQFTLQICACDDISNVGKLNKDTGKGQDNRTLVDNGSSQSLTYDCIEELRDIGTSPKDIIEQLVENSKTFQIKTEYSQEKYINKKEKKYFEYISVRFPTLRLLAEIFYNRDLPKFIGIRADTLSQLVTSLNFQSDGSYLLFENGFNGIVAAFLLNSLSNKGHIVNVTSNNQQQKQAVLAMNFPRSLLERFLTVRLSTLNDLIKSQNHHASTSNLPLDERCSSECEDKMNAHLLGSNGSSSEVQFHPSLCESSKINTESEFRSHTTETDSPACNFPESDLKPLKRKYCCLEKSEKPNEVKSPRWKLEAELASEVLFKKVDGIMIACKEYALDIVNLLLDYLLPSRPIVVYSLYNEPLVVLYSQLKRRHDIVCLRITETWLRPYQVIPERSHPSVSISPSSGFLLSGIKVNS